MRFEVVVVMVVVVVDASLGVVVEGWEKVLNWVGGRG